MLHEFLVAFRHLLASVGRNQCRCGGRGMDASL